MGPIADLLHFNHASASPPEPATYDAMHDYLRLEQQLGAHRAAHALQDSLADAATVVAQLVGAEATQMAFIDSASRGWALALSALPCQEGIDVFVGAGEWSANLMNLHRAPNTQACAIDLDDGEDWGPVLERVGTSARAGRVPVVSLPLIDCLGRATPPSRGLGARIQALGGWLFVDASQAVGQMPVDAAELGADVLVFPARKWLRGPRGIGALVLSARALHHLQAPWVMDIQGTQWSPDRQTCLHRPDASRFEAYACPPILQLGMRQAVRELLCSGPAQVFEQLCARAAHLREALRKLPHDIELLPGEHGIVCLRVLGCDPAAVVHRLHERDMNAALVTARYAPLSLGPNESLIRLSPHAHTPPEHIQRAADLLDQTLAELRT